MSEQNTKAVSSAVIFGVTFILIQEASGPLQVLGAVLAAIATTALVLLADRYVWRPIVRRAGLWGSALVVGAAIVMVGLAAGMAGIKLRGTKELLDVALRMAILVILFGWLLAALRGAQDKGGTGGSRSPA